MIRWLAVTVDVPAPSGSSMLAFWESATGWNRAVEHGGGGPGWTRSAALDGPTEPTSSAAAVATIALVPPDGDVVLRFRIEDPVGPVGPVDATGRAGASVGSGGGAAGGVGPSGTAHGGGVRLDLHVDDPLAAAEIARRIGAADAGPNDPMERSVADGATFRSPGGLVFRLVRSTTSADGVRPAPAGQALLDQVAVDIPGALFADEAAFWEQLTGWERRAAARREFEVLVRPPGMPLRLLLQRLGDDDGGRVVRAHLDLACGDQVAAVTDQHVRRGAEPVRVEANWTTLLDPSGRAYCLTARDPLTGLLPS